MNGVRALALIPVVLMLAACGAGEPESEPAATPAPAPIEVGAPLSYETNGTVLEDASHGPMLCLGVMLTSLPPQCGSVAIANWDWAAVEGEERRGDAVWGDFHVVGTYDGETFTMSDAGPVNRLEDVAEESEGDFEAACDEPPGGWVVPEQGRTYDMQASDVDEWAQEQGQYVASWITYLDENVQEKIEAGDEGPFAIVFNLVVDRDAETIESGARERWDGPLCVVERDLPTAGEAAGIRAEAEKSLEEYGLTMVGSDEGGVGEAAEIWVVADPGGAGQAIMDERFGDGLIRLVPQLVPVN